MDYTSFRDCLDAVHSDRDALSRPDREIEIYYLNGRFNYRVVELPVGEFAEGELWAIVTASGEPHHWIVAPQSEEGRKAWEEYKEIATKEGRAIQQLTSA